MTKTVGGVCAASGFVSPRPTRRTVKATETRLSSPIAKAAKAAVRLKVMMSATIVINESVHERKATMRSAVTVRKDRRKERPMPVVTDSSSSARSAGSPVT